MTYYEAMELARQTVKAIDALMENERSETARLLLRVVRMQANGAYVGLRGLE